MYVILVSNTVFANIVLSSLFLHSQNERAHEIHIIIQAFDMTSFRFRKGGWHLCFGCIVAELYTINKTQDQMGNRQ